jgi:hypothetical protein
MELRVERVTDCVMHFDDAGVTINIPEWFEWASHATGARECGWYHSDGSVRLVRSPAVAADVTSQVFLHYRRLITPTGWNAAYVKQTSGGNLDLTNAVYAIFRYR